MINNKSLINTALDWHNSNTWGYLFGASGQVFTRSLYEQYLSKYPVNSERHNNVRLAWIKWHERKVADCSGLIYCAMRSLGSNIRRFYTTNVPWATDSPHLITSMDDIPNIPGIALWCNGHIALLVDKNDSLPTIEARSTEHGVVRGEIAARFTHWGYLKGINYSCNTASPLHSTWQQFHPFRTVRLGDHGDDIVLLQIRLNSSIGSSLSCTGDFCSDTYAALRVFQKVNQLTADGICGRKTWSALGYTLSPNYNLNNQPPQFTPFRTIRPGDSGDDVKFMQLYLNNIYSGNLVIDGQYGRLTTTAVRNLQIKMNLVVDGICGPQTWSALGFVAKY